MKQLALVFTLFFLAPAISRAQENISNKRFIEVTGTSETEVVPDEITLLITLAENKESGSIQKQEDLLKSSVKELGIDPGNLSLSSADADYQRTRILKKEVVVTKSYQLKVGSADMVGKVYEKLDKMNASDAYIFKVDHSKMTDLKKESRIKAIKAAKDKVDYLLAAVGEKAGQAIQINEQEIYAPVYRMAKMAINSYSNDKFTDNGADEISFKKMMIKSGISVKYEILSK